MCHSVNGHCLSFSHHTNMYYYNNYWNLEMDLEITLFHHAMSSLFLARVLHYWKQQRGGKDHIKTLMCLLSICGGAAVGNIEALKDKTPPCSSRSPRVTPGPLPSPPQAACVKRALEEMVTSGPADSR